MRKYLSSVAGGLPLMQTPIASHDVHWSLFEAFVRGAISHLTTSDYNTLIACIADKDVESLFHFTSILDQRLIEYGDDKNVKEVRIERQIVCFLKKFPFSKGEYKNDRKAAGKKKFFDAEIQCRNTNLRLKALTRAELPSWVIQARHIISELLGDLTPERVMSILSEGNHGPGATLLSKRQRTTPYYKFMDLPYTCTKRAMPYATAAISCDIHWLNLLENSGSRRIIPIPGTPDYQKEMQLVSCCTEIVDSDNITFVPKDAKTDRPIAISASLNMYLQLGVKTYMEECLQSVGIDLTDQSLNRQYAYLGSRHSRVGDEPNPKQFSTIDLASASDTVSVELVRLLLDPEWFAFLDDLRHETGIIDDKLICYEKFSAMGNGFTFPLESLIFWAVSKAALDVNNLPSCINNLAVYGDDIICRFNGSGPVIDSLEWCGFSVNTEKSFLTGPFKESCGEDYYRGYDVRPFYLKRTIRTYEDIYFICNSIANKILAQGTSGGLQALYNACLSQIPARHRRYLPMASNADCGIRVPLASYRDAIRNPMLYPDELWRMRKKYERSFLEKDDPFYITETYVPIRYTGYSWCKLYLSLRSSPPTAYQETDREVAILASQGVITRRDSTKVVTCIQTISSWNSTYTIAALRKHPFHWVAA